MMREQSKAVQSRDAACLGKTVEGAGPGPGVLGMFGKLDSIRCSGNNLDDTSDQIYRVGHDNMSEAAGTVAMLSSRDDVVQDLSQEEEIITIDHQPHMSIDELLKVIKGANGMPVLFVPSSDGRLAAVAVDGLENLVLTNHHCKGPPENNQHDFRAWLLLLASLVATVTFASGLAPPGGFWSVDDTAKGYVTGTSVMMSIFPRRYLVFHYCNTTAFFSSVMIIGMLAKKKQITVLNNTVFGMLVCFCFISLGTSYTAGTAIGNHRGTIFTFCVFGVVFGYMWTKLFLGPLCGERAERIFTKYFLSS